MLGHVVDTERVFSYRALRFARNDATPLASFEQDGYVRAGDFGGAAEDDRALQGRKHEAGQGGGRGAGSAERG